MPSDSGLLERMKVLANAGKLRVRIHAARHMAEEDFSVADMAEAIAGKSRILENYPEQLRCLVVGFFQVSENVKSPLHLVCEYPQENDLEIVTAYIPQKPRWSSPWQRGRKK
ncbi:MAG: DUF4258 domain-containing protein [Blastocatellia bacterium]